MTKKRKVSFGIALVAMFLFVFLIFFGDNGLLELFRKRNDHSRLVTANQQLVQDNSRLYRMVDRLRNDPDFIEDVARKELGMVRADELIFTFASQGEKQQP